jgi:hypothetical protein
LYSSSLLHGGTPIDSGFGLPWVSRTKIEIYSGNPGIRDSAKLGPCCVTLLNDILAHHANHTHTLPEATRRALRQDLLANVSKEIRPLLVTYDPDGPWMGLVQHFLQTCGPPDILSAVYIMLDEARAENPPRTLQVRVQTLVFS